MNRTQRRASRANGRRLVKRGFDVWHDVTDMIAAIRVNAGFRKSETFERAAQNSMYIVQIHKQGEYRLAMIRRNDESVDVTWADKQRIKNELFGAERIAVEVFPAVSELIDDANIYHLWILPEGMKLPFRLS